MSGAYRVEHVDVDEVARWPRNPKLHDEAGIDESLQRFGFTAPLLLDETTGRIVAGHGRLEALLRRRAAGKPPPARVRVEGRRWLVPVLRGVSFASEAEAEAYLVADNRLTERGGWDQEALGEIVRDLQESGAGLAGTGFAADYGQRLAESFEAVPATGSAEELLKAERKVKCPECGAHVEVRRGLPGSVHASRVRKQKAKEGGA